MIKINELVLTEGGVLMQILVIIIIGLFIYNIYIATNGKTEEERNDAWSGLSRAITQILSRLLR